MAGKGKLKGLFKKKEGGSALGNALRFIGDKFTGGTYSSIFPKPTANDIEAGTKVVTDTNRRPSDEENARNDADYIAKRESKYSTKKIVIIASSVVGALIIIGIAVKKLFKPKKKK